jgi:hypothetical protein
MRAEVPRQGGQGWRAGFLSVSRQLHLIYFFDFACFLAGLPVAGAGGAFNRRHATSSNGMGLCAVCFCGGFGFTVLKAKLD